MPKKYTNRLTNEMLRDLNPDASLFKVSDGDGLHVVVQATGKFWRLSRRFNGKQKTWSLGVFPVVTVEEAREKKIEYLRLLAEGKDPSDVIREIKLLARLSTFEAVATEWHRLNSNLWSPVHAERTLIRLRKDIFPYTVGRSVRDLTSPVILSILERVQKRSVYTAHRLLQIISAVYRFAKAKGLVETNPAEGLSDALAPHREEHRAALTDPREVGALLAALHTYAGDPVTCTALKLAPLLALRPGELRRLEWREVDLDRAEIRIPPKKMKMRTAHVVMLSTQALAILREIRLLTGGGKLVFPSPRKDGKPISENTLRSALIRLGYTGEDQTTHGFRRTFSSMTNEAGFRPDVIEICLAHQERNKVRSAYNAAQYFQERRKLMQWWGDECDRLRTDRAVIDFRRAAEGK